MSKKNEIDNEEDKFIINNNNFIKFNFQKSHKNKIYIKDFLRLIIKKKIQKLFMYILLIIILLCILYLPFKNQILNEKLLYIKELIKNIKDIIEKTKIDYRKEVILDNQIYDIIYEENIDFSNYTSDIKPISIYIPTFYYCENNNYYINKSDNGWENIINTKSLYYNHNQPRKPINSHIYLGYYDLTNIEVIKKQIELAKSHGIYGFGIYYYWIGGIILYDKPLNIIYSSKEINFPFFLIWKNDYILNENFTNNINNNIKIMNNLKKNQNFINDIEIYLKYQNYIKINKKTVIGIYAPLKINNLEKVLSLWRKKARNKGIGELLILANINEYSYNNMKKMNLFNALYEFPPINLFSQKLIRNDNYYFYTNLIYKKLNESYNITNDVPIYRGIMLEWDNTPSRTDNISIFNEYSPEKFYILNKLIINWTRTFYNENNRFIIINSWNNWMEGSYLEPDSKTGFANLNSLSKALFNLPFKNYNYNISHLNKKKYIAIQVHIYYEDLIEEIINKTNNIPVLFDLYITSTSKNKTLIIEEYVKNFSKANKYIINEVENKGRDLLPFLSQLKMIVKNYKYICHIHSKKTIYSPEYGEKWRKYLYENLLGSTEIISEILFDFEMLDKLGLIIADNFYECIQYAIKFKGDDLKYTNYIINKLFPGYKVGKIIDFPAGNMFWARVSAIYQIFDLNDKNWFPNENNQQTGTIMHGIERIWIYLVKLNGFYYKKIFHHF